MNTRPELEDAIDELLLTVSRTSTVEICGYVSALWMKQGPELAKESGLSSPMMQTFYLLGLSMTTPEPAVEVPLSEVEWKRVPVLLNAITDSYAEMTLKKIAVGEVDPKKGYVAAMAFLNWFMAGRLAVSEQLETLVNHLCAPFDAFIEDACGISATQALEIVRWLRDALIDGWSRGEEITRDLLRFQKQWTHEAICRPDILATPPKATNYEEARKCAEAFNEWTRYPNCVMEAALGECFGNGTAQAFLRLFALSRGETAGLRYFASAEAPNPAEMAPLFRLEGDRVAAPMHAMLYNALYDRFDQVLRNGKMQDRYFRLRGRFLEDAANNLLLRVLPNTQVAIRKYFETPTGEFEHDGLLLSDGNLIVLEAKAADMKVPSRDAERAFRNLSDQFRSDRGIEHGYLQAMRVIDAIRQAEEPVSFFDEHGAEIARIHPRDVKQAFPVCITLESFGVLAIDPTLLLRVPSGAPNPWVTNLFDLETLVDGFERRGAEFLNYLRARRDYAGRLLSDDELNIAGRFLHEGDLPTPNQGEVCFITDYGDVFDDLYFAKHGIERDSLKDAVPGGANLDVRASLAAGSAVFVSDRAQPIRRRITKVGRNEPCQCGSGLKFKRCCGRARAESND